MTVPTSTTQDAMMLAQTMWSRSRRAGIDCSGCGALIEPHLRREGSLICQCCTQDDSE